MINFETSPGQYRHWKLCTDGEIAFLTMDVQEDAPLHQAVVLGSELIPPRAFVVDLLHGIAVH